MFHVEQCPIQRLAAIAGPTVQHRRGIARHDVHRKIAGQIRQALHRFAGNMNGIAARASFDADGYDPALAPCNTSHQTVGRPALTDLSIGIIGTK